MAYLAKGLAVTKSVGDVAVKTFAAVQRKSSCTKCIDNHVFVIVGLCFAKRRLQQYRDKLVHLLSHFGHVAIFFVHIHLPKSACGNIQMNILVAPDIKIHGPTVAP